MVNEPDDQLVRRALGGSRQAVEQLVRRLQPGVFALALRMLWRVEDAEDATQEILLRVLTRLSQFDGRSNLRTWVYRVATHYLLDVKKRPLERLTFEEFADDLSRGMSDQEVAEAESTVAVEEVKIGCTLALLQCLDREHRLAYILGEILGFSSNDASAAVGVTSATHRKRLQRARHQVESFTRRICGLVSDHAACRCHLRVPVAIRLGRIDPESPMFARAPNSFTQARNLVRRAERARQVVELHRRTNPKEPGSELARRILAVLG